MGEIAADIIAKAAIATDDIDMQTQLGLKAFLKSIPEGIGRELRRKHFKSFREALQEARFLQTVQDSEDLEKGKVFTVEKEPKEEPKVDIGQIVEACIKQFQAQTPGNRNNERQGKAKRRKYRCWCCDEEGHVLRQCPTVKRNRVAENKATRPWKSENQEVQGGTR